MTGDGFLEDPVSHHPVFCRSALVLATTNLGQDRLYTLDPGSLVTTEVRKQVINDCAAHLSHEIMSRFTDVQIFRRLSEQALWTIAVSTLNSFRTDLESQLSVSIAMSKNAGLQLKASVLATMDRDKKADGREARRVVLALLKRSLALPLLKHQKRLVVGDRVSFRWEGEESGHDPNRAGAGHFAVYHIAADKTVVLLK